MLVRPRQVVIARGHHQRDARIHQREVAQQDDRLRVERNRRAHIQMIAGQHHEIVGRRQAHHPIELRQRVVEVRDKKDAHDILCSGGPRIVGASVAFRTSTWPVKPS